MYSFLGDSIIREKLIFTHGNLSDESRDVQTIFRIDDKGISFGFDELLLKCGDYCDITFNTNTREGLSYCYQFILKTSWFQGVSSNNIEYQIFIDRIKIYSIATTSYFSPNQILYCFKSRLDSTKEIKIRLVAIKDVPDKSYCGEVYILHLDPKRDFGHEYAYEQLVIDSFHQLRERCDELRAVETCVCSVSKYNYDFKSGEKSGYATTVQSETIEKLSLPVTNKSGIDKVSKIRHALLYGSDRALLSDTGKVVDLDNLTSVPNGRFSVVVRGIKFDCFFFSKKSDTLYVVLNGSKTAPPPEFKRWSWYTAFDGDMLNISDPSYIVNEQLNLGWYYGTKEVNYRELTAELIKRIASALGYRKIYLYASSGGGAAALHVGGLIEDCTVISINPQIFPGLYHYAPYFKMRTEIDLLQEDKWHRNDGAYFILNCPKAKFLLVQNISSPDDFIQVQALERAMNQEFHYGLNRFGNIGIWLYDIASKVPHNAQEDQILYYAINRLAKTLETDIDWADLNSYYMIIAEMWRKQILSVEQLNDKKSQ